MSESESEAQPKTEAGAQTPGSIPVSLEKPTYTWKSGVRWKEATGWAMNDFSNSIFITIVVTAVYSPFFTKYVAPVSMTTTLWALTLNLPTVLTIFVIPIIGSIVDLTGHKVGWLLWTIGAFSVFTMLLFFVEPMSERNMIPLAMILVMFARLFFNINEAIGSSVLPNCVRDEKFLGLVSGYGWAVGYLGGTIGLGIVTFLVIGKETAANYAFTVRLGMLLTGVFCLLSGIPVGLALWRIRSEGTVTSTAEAIAARKGKSRCQLVLHHTRETFVQLGRTFAEMRRHHDLVIYLTAFFLYMIGVQAVVGFMSIYASDVIKLDAGMIAVMFVIIQVTAALGSFLFGLLETRVGPRVVIIITLVIWFVGVVLCVVAPELCEALNWNVKTFFIAVTPIAGLAMGPSQSCSRSLFSLLIPEALSGEAYSVWELLLNLSTIVSTLYGPIADGLDNRWAAGIMASTFIMAICVIFFLDTERGIAEKRIWETKYNNADAPSTSSSEPKKKNESEGGTIADLVVPNVR